MVTWNILRPFRIFNSHLLYIVVIWHIFSIFGILYQETSGNPGYDRSQTRGPFIMLSLEIENVWLMNILRTFCCVRHVRKKFQPSSIRGVPLWSLEICSKNFCCDLFEKSSVVTCSKNICYDLFKKYLLWLVRKTCAKTIIEIHSESFVFICRKHTGVCLSEKSVGHAFKAFQVIHT
jgi:hypothetical protein